MPLLLVWRSRTQPVDAVRLIWAVNPERRKATVYTPDMEQPLHLGIDGVLDGGDVLPGFRVKLVEVVGRGE